MNLAKSIFFYRFMRNMCAALPQPRARTLLSRLLAVMAKYSAVPSTSTTASSPRATYRALMPKPPPI